TSRSTAAVAVACTPRRRALGRDSSQSASTSGVVTSARRRSPPSAARTTRAACRQTVARPSIGRRVSSHTRTTSGSTRRSTTSAWSTPTSRARAAAASVRLRTLDVLGIALASSRGDWTPAVIDLAGEGGGECTVVGTTRTAPVPLAILVNGTLAHGLDFDDTHAASITHASAVIL